MISENLVDVLKRLRRDLPRWRRELREEDLGSSEIIGKATKALNRFEVLLRELLTGYLHKYSIDYDVELRQSCNGKSLGDLTLGQVVTCFDGMNARLTPLCRKVQPKLLKNRKLLTESEVRSLRAISKVRKSLHANDMEEILIAKTAELIDQIEAFLEYPLLTFYLENSA